MGTPHGGRHHRGGEGHPHCGSPGGENARTLSWIEEIRPHRDEEPAPRLLLRLAGEVLSQERVEAGAIGLEEEVISLSLYRGLRERLPRARFATISPVLHELRLIKSAEELAILRLGGTIAKIGANAFLEALREGATELEVASFAVREMNRALAALQPAAPSSAMAYCHAGPHTLTPHLHPTGRRVRRGEVVGLNVFPVIWGYLMELERTFVFGAPNPEQQRALQAVNRAFEAAKAAVRPGARMDTSRGWGGFRHSDVLVVTPEGNETITDFPRDLSYGAA